MSVVSGPDMESCHNLKQRLVQALQSLSLQTFVFGEFVHISGTLDFSIDGKQDYQVIVSEMTHPETRMVATPLPDTLNVKQDTNGFLSAVAIKTELKTEYDGEKKTPRKRGRPRKQPPVVPLESVDVDYDDDINYDDGDEDDEDDDDLDVGDDIDDEEYIPDVPVRVKDEADDDEEEEELEEENEGSDDTEIYEPHKPHKAKKRSMPKRGGRKFKGKVRKCPEPDCTYETDHSGHFTYHMIKHKGIKDFECDECGKGFFALDEVRRHKNKVHSKNWHCNKCTETFQLKSSLKEHLAVEHDFTIPGMLNGVNCTSCQAKFISNADLEKHINEKHNHICSICGESFLRPHLLGRHTASAHSEASLTCTECGKTCGSLGALKKHINRHREKEQGGFTCDICGKTFTSQGSMYHHKKGLHSGIKPYECTECDAKFNFNHSLKLHILKHKGIRPYPCTQCEKTYLTNNHLKMHTQAVHGAVKKFKCPICDKSFPYDNSLKMHMMLHADNRPFMCCICSKSFVSKSALKVHEATHVEGKHFECDICHKMYKTEMLLRAHRRRHTDDGSRFMCDICGSVFMYKSNLDAHYTVHGDSRNFQCKVCDKMFKTYATLYSHQQVHRTETPFACHCGKAFKSKERLKAHEIRHSGLKPHHCLICSNSFPDKGGLSKHMKTVHAKVPRFACPVCKKTCNRADNLRVHMKVHNDPELFKLSLKELSLTMEYVNDDGIDDDERHIAAEPLNRGAPRLGQHQQGISTFSSAEKQQQEFTTIRNHGNHGNMGAVMGPPMDPPEHMAEQPDLVIDDRVTAVEHHHGNHGNMQAVQATMAMDMSGSNNNTPGLIDLSTSTPSTHATQTTHATHITENHLPITNAAAHYAQLATAPAMYYPSLFQMNAILPPPPDGAHHYHSNQ